MRTIARLMPLGAILVWGPALAEKPFDAEDAAYIDWSWKNCGTTGTAKEHALADAATAIGAQRFHTQYQEQLHKIADIKRTPAEVNRLCATI